MEWKKSKPQNFWGEIAPNKHILHLYENEQAFLDLLTGFVGTGINSGEAVIVIATKQHLTEIEERLLAHGIHLPSLLKENQYIPVDANYLLSLFMVDGMPDPVLFEKKVTQLLKRAGNERRPLRAFGEMVAILLADGNKAATIKLESLWNEVCRKNVLSLFCAYPGSMLNDNKEMLHSVCCEHSEEITSNNPYSEIMYRSLTRVYDSIKTIS